MSRRRKPTPQSVYIWGMLEHVFQAYYGAPENRDRPGARARWRKLWEETTANEKLGRVPIDDAGYLLWVGSIIAMNDRHYHEATELLSSYFAHPEIEQAHAGSRTLNRCALATSVLFSGNEAAAVEIFRSLLECERKSMARMALLHMRGDLEHFLSERAGDQPASPALAELVEEMVNRFRRRVPQKKRLPEDSTYADLLRLLDSTFPPEGREALQREREDKSDPEAE